MSKNIGCCDSCQCAGPSVDVTASRIDALIVKEVMDRIIDHEKRNRNLNEENLVNIIKWLTTYNTINNKTSILSNIAMRLSKESNDNEHDQRLMTNSVDVINTHNQVASIKNTDSPTNYKIINAVDDGLKLIIQKSTYIKPEYDTLTPVNSMDIELMANGFRETQIKSEHCENSDTSKVSADHISGNNNLQLIIDKPHTIQNNGNTISETQTRSKTKNNFVDTNIVKKYKPGLKSKTKDVFYNPEATQIPKIIDKSNYGSVKKSMGLEEFPNNNLIIKNVPKYPPPYPKVPPHNSQPSWKNVPFAPILNISSVKNQVILNWNMKLTSRIAVIKNYELYVCQKTEKVPDVSMWKLIGEMEADTLPMECTLDSFTEGFTYYFALRAVDIHKRRGPFSTGKTSL